jgi:hypothetical protein
LKSFFLFLVPEASVPLNEDSHGRLHVASALVFSPQARGELNEIESGPVLRLILTAVLVLAAIFNKKVKQERKTPF